MSNSYNIGLNTIYQSKPVNKDNTVSPDVKPGLSKLTQADDYINYCRIKENNEDIFKASDGHEYNIMEILMSRIMFLNDYTDINNAPGSNLNNIFGSKNVKQLFESQTGKQFNAENIEKFLKGEIELSYEKTAGKNNRQAGRLSNPPYLRDKSSRYSSFVPYKKRTVLTDKEKVYYAKIYNLLDKAAKTKLDDCLKSGKLLQNNSNDNSSILENLYKIISQPRTKEIDKNTILKECISILDNPLIVTQQTEDIPDMYINTASECVYKTEEAVRQEKRKMAENSAYIMLVLDDEDVKVDKNSELKRIKEELIGRQVGTCVAASIEFTIASKYPAEFIRIIEGLTSEKKEVKKIIDCKSADLTDFDLKFFKIPVKTENNRSELTLKADDGAYVLADMQKKCQDDDERNTIDILFQSLVFQIGTQGTYNAISDKHYSSLNKDGGLNDVEKNYVLQILLGTKTQDKKDIAPDKDRNREKDIDDALNQGKYILVGINCSETEDNVEGHELTIIDKIKGLDGVEYYVCKDTDEIFSRPVLIKKDFLFERIMDMCVIN